MKNEENNRTCFECRKHSVCKYFLQTHEIPFDTMSPEYYKNHKELYKAVAKICSQYDDGKVVAWSGR